MISPATKLLSPDLLALLLTREDVESLRADAETLKHCLFETYAADRKKIWAEKLEAVNAGILRRLLPSAVESDPAPDPALWQEHLVSLQSELRSLPVVKATLAFNPSRGMLREIVQWLRRHWDSSAVVEVETDRTIGGGVILSFRGRYYDYSLRRRLREFLPQLWPGLAWQYVS